MCFNKLKLDLTAYKSVVVIGEGHDVKNTYTTQFYIIEKLAAHNYKNIFIEGGNAEAHLLNRFLKSGDTSLLEFTRAGFKNQPYRNFVKSIYLSKLSIKFIGFDFERPGSVNHLLKEWFQGKKIGQIDFSSTTKRIDSLALIVINNLADVEIRGNKFKVFLDSIKSDYSRNKAKYDKQLGENVTTFNEILNNPVYANFNSNKNFFVHRDRFFVKKMERYDKENSLDHSIIIVGRDHVVYANKFIPNLMDKFYNYNFINFIFQYHNCKNDDDGKIVVDDDPYFLKNSNSKEKRSIITFKKSKKQTLQTKYRHKYTTIWTVFYNQL
jgi:hypothetical protein